MKNTLQPSSPFVSQTNPNLVEDLKQKLKLRDDLLLRLGLAERRDTEIEIIEKPKVVITDEELKIYKKCRCDYVDLWNFRYRKEFKEAKQFRIKIKYPTGLTISDWFDKTCQEYEDSSCLFTDLDNNSIGCFFESWNVVFEVPQHKKVRIKKELDDSMVAKDKGIAYVNFFSFML